MAHPETAEVEVLVERADWVRGLARALVRDEHEAEDLAQDAWVAALSRGARTNETWAGWIGATMRNLARARWRGDRRRDAREHDAARPEAEPSSAEMLEQLDAHEALVRSVRALDEPYRTAILLRYFEGLQPREIAAREGVSVKTVDTRLYRALGRLRQQLDRRHGGDRRAWLALLCPLIRPKGAVVAGAVAVSVKLKVAAVAAVVVALLWIARERSASRANVVEAPRSTEVARELAPPAESPAAEASQRASVDEPVAAAKAEIALGENVKQQPQPIAGLVIDATDRPIGGVHVVARSKNSSSAPVIAEAATDTSGAFAMAITDDGAWLDVDAPTWAVVLRPRISFVAGKAHVFVLAPRRRVTGAVVDARGSPVSGVDVRFVVPRDVRAGIARVLDLSMNEAWATVADEAGAFAFDAAADLERCELLARSPGFDDARIALALGDQVDLRVVLADYAEPAKHLVGRVIDGNGAPIEGAWAAFDDMAMAGSQWETHDAARTNARGEFDVPVEWVAERPRRLVALAPGYLPTAVESTVDEAMRRETWPQPLELVLDQKSLAIEGRVLRSDGTPARGAIVAHVETTPFVAVPWATYPDGSTTWAHLGLEELLRGPNVREMFTDKSGRFELTGLLAQSYRLRVHDQATLDVVVTEPIAAGLRDVEVRLPSGELIERVAGRVVDSSGEPVTGAFVWLVRRAPGADDSAPRYLSELRTKTITTDAHGAFEFLRVSRAVDELRVQAPEQPTTVALPIADFEDVERIEVTVERTCNFKLDMTGSALSAAWIEVLDADDKALTLSESRGKVMSAGKFQTLHEQGTGTLLVSDRAKVLVFHDARGVEVTRMPIALKPGELTIVRP